MAHDLFPDGESGFDLDLGSDDLSAMPWIAGLALLAILALGAWLLWLDRSPPTVEQIRPASWISAPQHRERGFASLEVGRVP